MEQGLRRSPTLLTTSPTSLKSAHLDTLDRARKSSISLVPMLYPLSWDKKTYSELQILQVWTERTSPSSHLLELLVDLLIVFIVLDQLDDKGAVRESEELGILAVVQQGMRVGISRCDVSCTTKRGEILTIFSVLFFHRSSPAVLYCFADMIPDCGDGERGWTLSLDSALGLPCWNG